MNFTKIFQQQVLLDKAIMDAHAQNPIPHIQQKRIVALLVELGEFANEYAAFKYWKKNKVVDEHNLIEEFVDGIHFFSTMAIELGVEPQIDPIIVNDDKSLQLLETFNEVTKLGQAYSKAQVEKAFRLYLGIAKQLEITDEQISEHYEAKNQKNFERIKNNY